MQNNKCFLIFSIKWCQLMTIKIPYWLFNSVDLSKSNKLLKNSLQKLYNIYACTLYIYIVRTFCTKKVTNQSRIRIYIIIPFLFLSIYLFILLFNYLTIKIFIHPSIFLGLYLYISVIHMYIYLFIGLSISLSIYLYYIS